MDMDESMEAAPGPDLSAEAAASLAVGVHSCFRRWTALKLALEHGFGGRSASHKAVELANDAVAWLVHSKERQDWSDLEELLYDSMLTQFDTEVEDESTYQLARQLFILREECSQGNYETVHRLAADAEEKSIIPASEKSVMAQKASGEESENDDEDDSNMDEEEIQGRLHPSSSGQQVESMEMEPPCSQASKSSQNGGSGASRSSTLTEQEMADGWQEAPLTRRRRCGRGGKQT